MQALQNQATILLIESHSEWLTDVYSILQDAGFDLLIATGGDEGFCAARRVRPDLILCESALPDISGVQLCYMVRADKDLHESPFVLMGDADDKDGAPAIEAFRAGADDYFEKDCDRQFLITKICRLITLQRYESELRQRCMNQRRSERSLKKIIEETANLIAAINPSSKLPVFEGFDFPPSKNFSGRQTEFRQESFGEKADAPQVWQQSLQTKESFETSDFESCARRKVYYEVVY